MGPAARLHAQAADLTLAVRHVLAGLGHGAHTGRAQGAGVEFAEHRAYVPGDDWRRIDWKLMARAERYYVREAERDQHVAIWLWLDASASMAEPSRSLDGVDKLGMARLMLGCLAAIAQRQNDAFGLVVAGAGAVRVTPAARGAGQLRRVLGQLERTCPDGTLPGAGALRASLHMARAPGLVFAVSDFLDWPSDHAQALLRLRRMRHDVRALCLQTEAERKASFPTTPLWSDPEAPGSLYRLGQGAHDARSQYRRARDTHFGHLAQDCRRNDIPLHLAAIEEAPVKVLRAWLRAASPAAVARAPA